MQKGRSDKWTNIGVSTEVKNRLEELKIHPRQPFTEIIEQLLEQKEDQDAN